MQLRTSTSRITGKERDTESGLDNFGARYYAGSLGRFVQPDPLLSSGRPNHPQTWNRYSYSLNNPVNLVDPFGLYEWAPNTCAKDDKTCNKQYKENQEKFREGLRQLELGKSFFEKGSTEYNRLDSSAKAYGREGEANGVSIEFGAVKTGAAETVPDPSGNLSSFVVRFDTKKISGKDDWTIDIGHEGTHISDFRMPMNALMQQSAFSLEYRGFQTSSWVAQALGVRSLSVGGNEIWNTGWAAADRQTLRDKGITKEIVDHYPDHPETHPHNPLPN